MSCKSLVFALLLASSLASMQASAAHVQAPCALGRSLTVPMTPLLLAWQRVGAPAQQQV